MRNGENLSVIINDILDLSKVEAGHLTVESIDTYPEQIAQDVVHLLNLKAKEKDLSLEYVRDESTPIKITSDPTRVRQILINLVGNALKFTQFGSVKIRSFSEKSKDGKIYVGFEIRDTGVGIPETQKGRIFEMFVQADGSTTRRFGGTGLGLALSKRLAQMLGGDVMLVESAVGKGSTFKVLIENSPAKPSEKPVPLNEPQKRITSGNLRPLEGLRILVVDDSPDNQQLIWHYLTKRGAIVDSAANGMLGVRMAFTGDYDVVLMDIQMPEMDGYTAIDKLRSGGYAKPIIALTAHATIEVRDKVLNLGANSHVTKPINVQELISAITQLN
jgi:CheY-like chemotaxis protein